MVTSVHHKTVRKRICKFLNVHVPHIRHSIDGELLVQPKARICDLGTMPIRPKHYLQKAKHDLAVLLYGKFLEWDD